MDEVKYRYARKLILWNLLNSKKWGGAHTHYKHAFAGLPRSAWGSKEVKNAFSDLVKEGKVIIKKTVEEPHVSLNSRFVKEIQAESNSSTNTQYYMKRKDLNIGGKT